MNSAVRARCLASSEVISKYYSAPSNRRDKIAREEFNFRPFCGILTKINYFFGSCVVYTKTIIHLSLGESGGYLPSRETAR